MQAGFLAASAPPISQYPAIAYNQDVRDKLLETLILFGLAPVPIHQICRVRCNGEVLLDCQVKALEHAQLFEKLPLKTKHSFFRCHSPICHSTSRLAILNLTYQGKPASSSARRSRPGRLSSRAYSSR
jgi:hypothetical protein